MTFSSGPALTLTACAFLLGAQAPPPRPAAPRGFPAPVRSPEVHAGRPVTFRLRAPQAAAPGDLDLQLPHPGRGRRAPGPGRRVHELHLYVLAYSGGFGGLGPAPSEGIELQSPWKELLANSGETKKWLRLRFLGCGQQETGMLAPGRRLVQFFQEQGVNARWSDYPGAHVFSVWRNHLHETAPMLFNPPKSAK